MKYKQILILIILIITIYVAVQDSSYDTLIYKITAGALFFYCINKGLKEEFLVNPYSLFAITPLSILVYSASFAPMYLNELTASTWFLAVYNILGFIIGYSVLNIKQKQEQPSINSADIHKLRYHILILGILSIIPVAGRYLHIALPFRSFMNFFCYIGLAMAFKSKNKGNIVIALLFILVGFLEDFNKSRFLSLILSTIICYEVYYVKNINQRKKVVYSILAAGVFMILVAFPMKSFIRDGGSYVDFVSNAESISSTAFEHYNDRFVFNGPEFLKMPYMYLVSAWNNVQYVAETQDYRTYGMWTIKPFLNYLGFNTTESNPVYVLIPESSFNTFTYITVLFKDYGYWGSILGSLLLGMYVKFARRRCCTNGSVFDTATYGLVCVATLQMYFSNHFFGMSYPFTILIIGFLYKKIFKLERY